VARFYEQLIERIHALPGVEAVAETSAAPLHPDQLAWDDLNLYGIVGEPSAAARPGGHPASSHRITPEFFQTMDAHLLAGRNLQPTDGRDSPGVAVVNQTFAKAYLPGQNPLGHQITLPNADGVWRPGGAAFVLGERTIDQAEIVGVVSDMKTDALSQPAAPAIYFAKEQWTTRRGVVVIRAHSDRPANLIPAVRRELKAMDPTVAPKFDIYTDVIAGSLSRQRLAAVLLAAFGVLALILAAVGIYGLMSYSVTQQSREIAVRAAMGASPSDVLRLIIRRALELAGAGIVLGVLAAVALRQFVASQLYEVSALDLPVFLLVPLVLLAVALLSSYLPARRAARIDPAVMLRSN
jgi:putative ABC transport system permease protein